MANTLNLGNGNWATKEDSLLAYNSENGNFKPLPFDFTRASSATVVNKAGLIETVGSGEPRIDFSNDANGALLLEPTRSNLVRNSEDLTQWTNYNANAVLSEETIYGKNAYKIVEDSTVNYHGIYLTNLFTADGTNYIWSVYVKGAERRYVVLTGRTGISSNDSALIFDTQDGVWVLDSSSQNQALSTESVGNGWWRISMEGNPTSGAYDSYTIAASLGGSTYTDANYQGDGTSGIYVAMAQAEQGSYATSYIPTQGSAVTRNSDSCNQTTPSGVIGQTEGTMFVEAKCNFNLQGARLLLIGAGSNFIEIVLRTSGVVNLFAYNGSAQADINSSSTYTTGDTLKIAVGYKANDFILYINGVQEGLDILGVVPTLVNQLLVNNYIGGAYHSSNFYKDIKLYNTRLTNSELATLTSL